MPTRFRDTFRVALAWATVITSSAFAANDFAPTQIACSEGCMTTIEHWEIQSTAKAQQSGAEVSGGVYSTRDWFPVSGRATVMAGLLENGKYPDVFHSDNLRAIEIPDASGNQFVVPWWYRTQFTLTKAARGTHTLVRTNGVIASADVWANGHLVADRMTVAGAYPVYEFDVTPWVHEGTNWLALRVYPADPQRALARNDLTVTEAEKQLIIRALKETRGNRTLAAKKIGMSRRTLHRKLHTYGLEEF